MKIVAGQLSVTEAAEEFGISRRHLHRLLARYRDEGLDGLEARSRAPKSSPHAATDRVRDRIVQLRVALTATGTDAGPVTIAWHLHQEGLRAPSTSTIRRIHRLWPVSTVRRRSSLPTSMPIPVRRFVRALRLIVPACTARS
ncbi:helix-turn-helix domain-containing protein, partial [Microbacterium schleiferi]|uniref:helix-turn-helix domain-containing protein n=1 Tax=Microbacterium schleiferi TaxID=69362 RepID=UPI0035C7FC40